jgi:hypothetical protein|nr:MAG TPA: hypothetical protein [Caudoviricetes sp.]
MDIMSRVFLVNEVRLYPPSERRKLIYIHSKLVTSIEADFTRHCKIFVAGLGGVEEECRFAWNSSAHQYRMVDKWNQMSMIPVFQSYAEARNWAETRMKEAIAEGYIVAFPEQKTTKKQPNPPTWNRKE